MRKYIIKLAVVTLAVLSGLTSCSDIDDKTFVPDRKASGIDIGNLDTSVRPADDFYQYACGGWMTNNPLPAAYSRYGRFEQLSEENNRRIKTIMDESLNNTYASGTTEQKLADIYRLALDSLRRNREGVEPLMGIIRQLEQAATQEQLFMVQLQLAPQGYSGFMDIDFDADDKNSSQNILKVAQGGTALKQKEYYLDTDDATVSIREAYMQNIIKLFQRFGFTPEQAQEKMTNIMYIETELAKVSRSNTELRDPMANYNKMTLTQFESAYPNIRLETVMNAMGFQSVHIQELVVGQPEFMAGANLLISTMTTTQYRDYMEWKQIKEYAQYLDDTTYTIYFEFFGRVLSGSQKEYPLWQRSISQLDKQIGEAIGKLYIEKYFPAAAKERILQLISNLKGALRERIDAQEWMSDATKTAAKEKLNAISVKVGYPDKWTDMSDLHIDPDKSYLENIIQCQRFNKALMVQEKAGKPTDPDKWLISPQTVNAYYNPFNNEICFTAGILQPPFFDMEADDAVNYGSIGVIIGHEMIHGFDDQGRLYDKDGNMREWWTDSDVEKFNEKADMYAEFFDSIEVLPGLNANGRLTLGENLADHGGIQVAWKAYKNATKTQPLPTIDGFTADQRFFLSYANVWAQNITEAEIRHLTTTDVHSLARWRVNGALPHIDAWCEVFDVKEGDKLYIPKEKRLNLW